LSKASNSRSAWVELREIEDLLLKMCKSAMLPAVSGEFSLLKSAMNTSTLQPLT